MPDDLSMSRPAVELGELLARTVESVAAAQSALDRHADASRRALESDPDAPRVPPLWYTFSRVSLEVALSAQVGAGATPGSASLRARPVDAPMLGLYGYTASTSLVVRLELEPRVGTPDAD